MKGSTKSPKTPNPDLLRLNLKQFSTKSPNKLSDASLPAPLTNRSDQHISTRLNIIRLDTDANSHMTTSSSLPMTAHSGSGTYLLNNLTSSLQGNVQFLNECLGTFRNRAITQLNFDEIGHLVYDPKVSGFSRTFTEMGPLKARKTTEINTETTMSQTARSFHKMGINNPSGSLTARGTESGPKTLPVPINIKKISRMKSESQLKKGIKANIPTSVETHGKVHASTRVFLDHDKVDVGHSQAKNHFKEEKGVISVVKRQSDSTGVTSTGTLQENKNEKRGLPVLKRRNVSHGGGIKETKETIFLREEEPVFLTSPDQAKLSSHRNRTKSMANIKQNLVSRGGENITYDNEERKMTFLLPTEPSELRLPLNPIEKEMEPSTPGNQSALFNRKRGRSDVLTPRNGLAPHSPMAKDPVPRLNVLKLNLNNSHTEGKEVEEGSAREDILKNMESLLSPNLEWQGITVNDNQSNGKANKSLSSQGSGNEKDGKQRDVNNNKESKNLENNVETKKKGTKIFKKKVLALKIGKSFINSLKKKEPSSANNNNKPKGKELQPITEISTPPKKLTLASTPPKKPALPSPPRKPEIVIESASPVSRNKSQEAPLPKHRSSLFSNKSKDEPDSATTHKHHHHKSRKSISGAPLIRISPTGDSNKLQVSSSKSSRRASRDRNVLSPGGPKFYTFEGDGQKLLARKKTLDNPQSWFNFENKTVEIKLKKLRSFRANNTEPTNVNPQSDAQTEFLIFFDQTIRNSYKTLFNNNNNTVPPQTLPNASEPIKLNLSKTNTVARQVSQVNITLESPEEAKPEPEVRRNITIDNETTMVSKGQQSTYAQISQLGSPLLTNITEDLSKNSVKMYARRDIMFTINISPPDEEIGHEDPVLSSGANSPAKILEGLDSSSPENVSNDTGLGHGVIQYRFDTNRSKTIEEDPEANDKWNETVVGSSMFDYSFRKTTEELFKFDEIYKSVMDNFNTKSQRLRIRSNFLSFVEKVIVTPMEGWVDSQMLNNLLTISAKKIVSPKASSVASNYHNKNKEVFKYEAKNFHLCYDPFQNEFIFLLKRESNGSSLEKLKHLEEGYFQEDDTDDQQKILKSPNLIFVSGEVFACEGKLDCYSEFNRTLSFKPILGGMKHETLLGMKKILFDYTFKDIKRGEFIVVENHSLKHIEMYKVVIMNDENWKYLNRCMLKMFRGSLYGCFELKVPLGEEKIVKDEDADKTPDGADAKLNKKRNMLFSGKTWRSGSVNNQLMFQAGRKSKNILENIINKQSNSNSANMEDPEEEKELEGEKKSKKEILLGDNLKVDTLRTPRQDKPRRYSKTSIKPIVHSVSERNKQNLVIAIEKSNTTVEPNNKDLSQSQLVAVQKFMKMATNTSNPDTKAKLQIPRMDSNRQASSSTPFGRQETKVESPERKPGEKPTINYSLTPQSDPSPPGRDDNGALSHQSTINLQWTKEKTKTRIDISERDSVIRRDPSSGGLSQHKDKEETTTKEILKALQAGRNRGETSAGVHKLGMMKKEKSSRNLVKRFGGGEGNNNNNNDNNNNNNIYTNEEANPMKVDKIGVPFANEKPTKQPKRQEQALDKFMFDAVYTNKYLEIKELLTLYPKTAQHVKDEERNTLLMAAAQAGYIPIADLLLQSGSDINVQNKDGNTALHISLAYHNYKLADLLISHGAKQNITNAKGKTAWES